MKKLFSIIILITLILSVSFTVVLAAEEENKSSYSVESDYNLYKERVENICNKYLYINKDENNDKIKLLINIKDDYLEINEENRYSLSDIKNIHKTNMNNIYKCALLNVQKKSLLLVKNDLIKKSPSLGKKISGKIDNKVNQIKLSMQTLKCIDGKEINSIQKLNVLSQATYQTCKYVSYLEYLKEYNKKLKNILPEDREKYSLAEAANMEIERLNEVDLEIEHTYKVFPLAFHAYTEYENNITIHFLLELLREDYITLREKLHKAINPINQVVYKIANAMKK